MTRRLLVLLAAAVLGLATSAAAQTPSGAKPKPAPKRAKEFFVGGVITGPSSMGSADATLFDGTGSAVTLFRVENGLGVGYGLEAGFGLQVSKALWVEATGGWTRSSLTSKISDDFEGADSETISSPMSRFLIEGAALWYFRDRGKTAWFVRASGGWMRETAGGASLTDDGFIAGGGVGVRHWWRTNGKGTVKRVGLRAEFRADVRSGGISLGDNSLRFGPAGVAHLVFGF